MIRISIFLSESSLLMRFSLCIFDLALTVDTLKYFTISSQFSSVCCFLSEILCVYFVLFFFLFCCFSGSLV